MIATLPSRLKNDSSPSNLLDHVGLAPKITPRECNVEAEANTWDSLIDSLRNATQEAIANRAIAELDYKKLELEVDIWERRLQIALKNNCNDLVRKTLLRKTDCIDKVGNLKVLIEQYSIQISTLQSQLAFWANQLSD